MILPLDYRCARCGRSVGNGAVTECAIVSDIEATGDPDAPWRPRQLRFCRVPNPGAPDGCAEHLLVPSNLTAHDDALKETTR